MITNRDGSPVLVSTEGASVVGQPLSRTPLDQWPMEDWLQQVLDQVPSVLPIAEIDERIKGREAT